MEKRVHDSETVKFPYGVTASMFCLETSNCLQELDLPIGLLALLHGDAKSAELHRTSDTKILIDYVLQQSLSEHARDSFFWRR